MLTQNEDAFRALDFGADDFDLPIEDEVTQKAGARIDLDLEGLLAIPRRLGYRGRVPPRGAAGRAGLGLRRQEFLELQLDVARMHRSKVVGSRPRQRHRECRRPCTCRVVPSCSHRVPQRVQIRQVVLRDP